MLNGDLNLNIKSNRRRAISPVIAALILSAVVMAVGGAVWSFSQGAMTITAEDYAEAVINMTETISERFIIEHVNHSATELSVWIYNYGDVDIEVKIQYEGVTEPAGSDDWIEVASKDLKHVRITDFNSAPRELNVNAYSKRGNNAYYRYLVPQG